MSGSKAIRRFIFISECVNVLCSVIIILYNLDHLVTHLNVSSCNYDMSPLLPIWGYETYWSAPLNDKDVEMSEGRQGYASKR